MFSTRNIPKTKEPRKVEINGGTNMLQANTNKKIGNGFANNNKLNSNC